MLGVLFDNIPNSVNRNLRLTQALIKEGVKFLSSDWNIDFIVHLPLVLLPAKKSGIFEKDGSKWYPILTFGPGGGKMVFTLLKEVIIL